MRNWLFGFDDRREIALANWGLFFLRVGVGANMIISHGWGKLMRLGNSPVQFADPFGLGPAVTLYFAVLAEVFCSLALIFGIFTRLATIPLIITMATAMLIIHADDPWQRQEFAMMFLIPFITLLLAGPGRFSLDAILRGNSAVPGAITNPTNVSQGV